MKFRHVLFAMLIVGLWSVTALAVTPEGGLMDVHKPLTIAPASKAFGDPTDFKAAGMASAQYVMNMQSTVADVDDGGWDWVTSSFVHSANNSSGNLYGVTASVLYVMYKMDPTPELFDAMTTAADFMVGNGPNSAYDIDSGPDIVFLMGYASLPGVTNPLLYTEGARLIFDTRKTENGSAAGICEAIYSSRFTQNLPGLGPWDLTSYCVGGKMLAGAYGAPYDQDYLDIANYAYDDAFIDGNAHDYFKVLDTGSGDNYYTLGLSGIIGMFQTAGIHATEVQTMLGLLRDCQYDDGGFNWKYGTDPNVGGPDYQSTAYAVMALSPYTSDPLNSTALYDGAAWLGTYQDASGGFLYSGGDHYPEEGAECGVALLAAAKRAGTSISASLPVDGDLLNCSESNVATFSLDVNEATPLVIGFEVVVSITATGTLPTSIAIAQAGQLPDFFQVTGDNPYSVNGSFYLGNGISADTDLFTITLDGLSEGTVDIAVDSYNLRGPGNVFIFGDVSGTSFDVDCTAPAAVTDITAAPHHNKVEVGWTHDGTDVDHYRVYRGLWDNGTLGVSCYPEYDDIPTNHIPAHPASGLPVPGQGWVRADDPLTPPGPAVDSFFDIFTEVPDDLQRGVYYYEVYAEDAAGNISDPAAANARATNYWLGDMTNAPGGNADGLVTPLPDITLLAAAFGEGSTDPNYNAYTDVGPTDDWSRVGIPTTDNVINFEDLMVFSMNFGVVSPTNKTHTPLSVNARFAWVEAGEGQYALRLVEGTGIKGVHVRAALPEGAVVTAMAGQLLDEQSELTFLKNIGKTLDASIAVMGQNNGFVGTGDLMVVSSSSPIAAADLDLVARGYDNSEIQVSLDENSGTVTPRVFALRSNYPNPFNPMTKISFSLPEAQDVLLNVYGVDGSKVATLINEMRPAGLHEVVWTGRDDAGQAVASGTYFYRIQAGPYSQVRKMTLMK